MGFGIDDYIAWSLFPGAVASGYKGARQRLRSFARNWWGLPNSFGDPLDVSIPTTYSGRPRKRSRVSSKEPGKGPGWPLIPLNWPKLPSLPTLPDRDDSPESRKRSIGTAMELSVCEENVIMS